MSGNLKHGQEPRYFGYSGGVHVVSEASLCSKVIKASAMPGANVTGVSFGDILRLFDVKMSSILTS